MKSYIIHFLRHGSIDETLSGKYIGTTDVPLSDKGKIELRKLDYEYRYPGCQAVFTSPLKRCTQTCKILYPEQNPLVIANLSECNFGEWEGKTANDLNEDEDFQKWLAGDPSVKPPRGERAMPISHAESAKYLKALLRDLSKQAQQKALLSHTAAL
ncbi:MAG: histidine phosphatase family protein [Ruminococcus sp.]